MGQKSNVDRAFSDRYAYKTGKKRIGWKRPERYILIVCEGAKTEPNYFKSIQSTLPRGRVVIDIEGTGMNTLSLVEEVVKRRERAKRERNRIYDESWAVFDKDSFPDQSFNNAIAKGLSQHVQCAWSNEAFELWYILHFQFRNTGMSREDYQQCINEEISVRSGKKFTYEKNSIAMFDLLQKYGNETDAIKHSKKLLELFPDQKYASHNPCTLVFKLVESLNRLR